MVPLGPRLDFRTAARPLAALMFMKSAAAGPMTSALGLSVLTEEADAILGKRGRREGGGERKEKKGNGTEWEIFSERSMFCVGLRSNRSLFPLFLAFRSTRLEKEMACRRPRGSRLHRDSRRGAPRDARICRLQGARRGKEKGERGEGNEKYY